MRALGSSCFRYLLAGAVWLRAAEPGEHLVRHVEERYQPPDHPIRLQFREGRYLKFYVLEAV